jgi:hypothetical protein
MKLGRECGKGRQISTRHCSKWRQIHCRLLPLFPPRFAPDFFLTIWLGDGVCLQNVIHAPSNPSFSPLAERIFFRFVASRTFQSFGLCGHLSEVHFNTH